MSLYLQVGIGEGLYLLEAARIFEIWPGTGNAGPVRWQDRTIGTVDLRQLFAEPAESAGWCALFERRTGDAVGLIVDRVDGLIEHGDADFAPLPPIGKVGLLIDAISKLPTKTRPALRLRGERALATAAALS